VPQGAVPADSVDLLSPVTAPARVVAQAVNYRSHATDSGFDPDTVPPAFFRKASHSITSPTGDIIRPEGIGSLDYEVELGLVIGADLPAGTTVTDADLARYVTDDRGPDDQSSTDAVPPASVSSRPACHSSSPPPPNTRAARAPWRVSPLGGRARS
jgi:hypothetical protein